MPVRSTGLEQSKVQPKKSSRLHHSTSNTTHNQSVATENVLSEQTDPFYQWYQMMSQYYRQFYPGYQLPQPSLTTSGHFVPSSTPLLAPTYSAPGARQQSIYPSSTPIAPGAGLDYMSYYYQYYYGANAVPFWPPHTYPVGDPTGRTTPKLFPTPHIKAILSSPGFLVQVLPNRPMDGELARVELVDLSDLAAQAVAEAAKRLSDTGNASTNLTRLTELSLCRDAENLHDGFSSGASGVDSPGRLSSVQVVGGGDDEAEEARACAAIAMAWDRTDHLLYPGPLSRSETLKADVLAFLREKLAEIQDRLPIDWESAGLLISYLESMVKNNGNIQPSDLVNLLLEGHEPQTCDLRARCTNHSDRSGSYIGLSLSQNQLTRNRSYLNDSLASLSPSQPPSGRQSPQTPYGMVRQSSSRAASDAGGLSNTQALLRRAAAAVSTLAPGNHGADTEDQALDRFRELLMHGMTMKALEHACRTRLWGHAFVLAQRLGTPVFDKVMERFINRAVAITDPILTLYQLTAGEMPQAVTAAAYGRGSDNGEWRPHLAMILAAESARPELMHSALDRLGDGLLSRHLVYAAHLCYLLMGPQYKQAKTNRGPVYCLPDKIWLLGVPVTSVGDASSTPGPNASDTKADSYSPLKVASEAIQLTEIYEYAMKLANRNYRLPQLLPLKLVYATRLIDAGLLDKANRYLTAIGTELLLEASNQDITANSDQFPVLYSLVTNCLRLAEPLRNYSELDGFDSHLMSSASRNSRFSGLADGPILSPFGSNADWLERLRDLHRTMDRHLIRSEYHSADSKPKALASSAAPQTSTSASQPQAFAAPADYQASAPLNHTQTPTTSAHFRAPMTSYQPPPIPLKEEPPESSKCNPMPVGHTHSDQAETWRSSSIDFQQHSAVESSVTSGAVSAYLIPDQNRYPVQALPSHLPEHARTSMIPPSQCSQNVDSYTHQTSYPTQVNTVHQTHLDPSKGIDLSGNGPSTNFHEAQSTFAFQRTSASLRSTQTQPSHCSPGFDKAHASPGSGPVPEDSSASSGLSQDTSMLFSSHSQSPDTSTRFPQPVPVSADQATPNMFFTPATVSSQDDAPGTGGGSTAFDYFAGLQHQSVDETGHRSRTVSGGSQSSLVGPYASTSNAPVQAPTAPRSRPAGGHCTPRRNSGTPERPYLPQSQQQLQASTRSTNHPGEIHQAIKEEPLYDDEQPRDSGQESNHSKEGWFSGWFGKRKRNGAKSVHLPDDSKPSIVWDDQLKQWIDINNPEAHEPTPPPPPATSISANVPTSLPKVDGAPYNRVAGRTSNRSRYVNVFANQTYGSAASKTDAPLQPPLPPTMFAVRSSDVLQDRLLNEHNMRPHYNAHVDLSSSR